MQKRNFGKMSQTKYTHLADQDTSAPRVSRPGGFSSVGGGKMECFRCGGDHMKKGAVSGLAYISEGRLAN